MRVFVTGASGWVGSVTVKELVDAGHTVAGLARSEESAAAVEAAGARAVLGSLDDLDLLKAEAASADGTIHTAFNHDFSRFAENCAQDARAIEAMGKALAGSGKPLVVTAGAAIPTTDGLLTEQFAAPAVSERYPRASEQAAFSTLDMDVRAMIVRLPPTTHGKGDKGFMPILINIAREQGFAAYVEGVAAIWPAVHRFDAARVFRLALEKGAAGDRFHAAAEEGIAMQDIAAAIGRGLGLPVRAIAPDEAQAYYGWFSHFARLESRASSEWTRRKLGWEPAHKTLLEDLSERYYFES
ncbi:SDR family oxidoreductase [Martelella radicis]|uniref:Nucleoside-diphosphate-sugar epimerase n=1 Tax=Martelella radicis TaxID=1397476 RepID=A0A7W6KJS0_9HYPH|nr:SDR family oxidoreductase [Martelella radicis]MBB4121208.1 nucleoside-diphosphate-sugar epimerase [Martelella radicis]